jgi:hypothetical protein
VRRFTDKVIRFLVPVNLKASAQEVAKNLIARVDRVPKAVTRHVVADFRNQVPWRTLGHMQILVSM